MRVIITGSTGMVGEGVMLECIQNKNVIEILLLNRKPSGHASPKVKEIIVSDFMALDGIKNQLANFDACFFCAGISSVGLKEEAYRHITYEITMHVARTLSSINSAMTFIYVSGSGTDSSEKGKLMWARVKGKTENDLTKLPFKAVYNFRPGIMKSTPGQKNIKWGFKIIDTLYPMLNFLFPSFVSTLQELALAMIHLIIKPYESSTIEVKDIKILAIQNQLIDK